LKILVTNDDGVHSDGLWAVVKELKEVGKVIVVAPDRDQSGVGTAVTLRHPLRLTEMKAPISGVKAYSVEGTPGDSVILAIKYAIKDKIDLVVSGINEGPNLGNDVFISGTIGGALQGYFYGIPSIAVSVAAFEGLYFEVAARMAKMLAVGFQKRALPRKLLLNVNLPNLPQEKIEGIEITKLGERSYTDNINQGHDGKRDYYWIVRGVPEWSVSPGTDVWALEQNRISITSFPDPNDLNGYNEQFFKNLATELLGK
jgi:5'-nucleotidase